jgi:hypothetical protein
VRVLQFIAVIGLALVCVVAAAYAGKRVAFVIGNDAYCNFAGLANPKSDATEVPCTRLQGDQNCRRFGCPSYQNAYHLNLASFRLGPSSLMFARNRGSGMSCLAPSAGRRQEPERTAA